MTLAQIKGCEMKITYAKIWTYLQAEKLGVQLFSVTAFSLPQTRRREEPKRQQKVLVELLPRFSNPRPSDFPSSHLEA